MTDTTGSETALVRQMALTHKEFLRTLPAASAGWEHDTAGSRMLLSRNGLRVEIRLGAQRERRIGSLCLPQTEVELRFVGLDEDARRAFLRRFDLAYQRGGG